MYWNRTQDWFMEPLRSLEAFHRQVSRLLEEGEGSIRVNAWVGEKEAVVVAELPGVSRERVRVGLEDQVLTLSVAAEAGEGEAVGTRIERSRRLRLPFPAEAEGVTAVLRDGLLTVKVPKAAHAVPRKIDIQYA